MGLGGFFKKTGKVVATPVTFPAKKLKNGVDILRAYTKVDHLWTMFTEASASHERSRVDPMSKSMFLSKTFWLNVLTTLIELMNLLPLPAPMVTTINGVLNIVLRFFFTDTPVHLIKGDENAWMNDFISKDWFASKTFWWNVLVSIIDIAQILPLPAGVLTVVNSIGNIGLRYFTSKAVAFR